MKEEQDSRAQTFRGLQEAQVFLSLRCRIFKQPFMQSCQHCDKTVSNNNYAKNCVKNKPRPALRFGLFILFILPSAIEVTAAVILRFRVPWLRLGVFAANGPWGLRPNLPVGSLRTQERTTNHRQQGGDYGGRYGLQCPDHALLFHGWSLHSFGPVAL